MRHAVVVALCTNTGSALYAVRSRLKSTQQGPYFFFFFDLLLGCLGRFLPVPYKAAALAGVAKNTKMERLTAFDCLVPAMTVGLGFRPVNDSKMS